MVVLLLLYFTAANGRPNPVSFLTMGLYVAVPTLLLRWHLNERGRLWMQLLAALLLWIPLEPDLFWNLARLIVGQPWEASALALSVIPQLDVSLLGSLFWIPAPVPVLIGLNLTLFLFLVAHPISNVGFTFAFNKQDIKQAIAGFFGISAILIPVGLRIGFLAFRPQWPGIATVSQWAIFGYLLVALVEEILFRGIIQNLLMALMAQNVASPSGRRWARMASLLLASFIFGLSHLNNTTPGLLAPNWGYVLMATLAGIGYGWVWLQTGKVTVSAIAHASINLCWGLFLR